jgi:PucR family transcriptional regulator, purine catabolism regulatory protein
MCAAGTLTVAEALRLPPLQRGLPEVVEGHAHLDRPIRWAHAGEVPDIAALLLGGELLLTTGLGMGKTAAQQRRFIADLAGQGIAALVIELGQSFRAIPTPVRQAARARGVCLVALMRPVRFVEVTEAIHTELIDHRYAVMCRGEQIQAALVGVMLNGGGIPAVLEALAEELGNPVVLESAEGRLLLHGGDVDAVDAWATSRQNGRSGAPREPVPMGGTGRSGWLVVLPIHRPVAEVDGLALRHAAMIVGLALLRRRQEEELHAEERGSFLTALADARVKGDDASRLAALNGFQFRGTHVIAVAAELAGSPREIPAATLIRELERELEGLGVSALIGTAPEQRLFGVAGVTSGGAVAAIAGHFLQALRAVRSRRGESSDAIVAVGAPTAWADAGDALAEALETVACAKHLPAQEWYDVDQHSLHRLLWTMRSSDSLRGFVARNLEPLLEQDARRKLRLLPTLEAFCAHGGRKADTARALHLHRQALYKRLGRIESVLKVDLSEPGRLATLTVAVEGLRYLSPGVTSPVRNANTIA